jgi:hypothetical protein
MTKWVHLCLKCESNGKTARGEFLQSRKKHNTPTLIVNILVLADTSLSLAIILITDLLVVANVSLL